MGRGTARSVVEGATRYRRLAVDPPNRFPSNEFQHAVQSIPDVQRTESDDTNAFPGEPCCPTSVMGDAFVIVMRCAINLNRELGSCAVEV